MSSENNNIPQKSEKIERILEFISSVKGIHKVKLLEEPEKRIILELEEQAEKRALMGLMPGINQGVREALSRSFTVAAITRNDFEWPKKGLIKIVHNDEILGEDVRDQKELECLKKEGHAVIANFIVIYKDKYNKFKELGFRRTTLIIAPLDLAWAREIPHAQRTVIGSPSPPADMFIKKLMDIGVENNFGSILVGFDLDSED